MKKEKRSEFRKHKRSGHPAYIYARVGDEFMFLGITHSEITADIRNIKLETNPDPEDIKSAYIKPYVEKDKTNRFGTIKRDWRFSNKDKKKAEKVIKGKKRRSAPSKSKK